MTARLPTFHPHWILCRSVVYNIATFGLNKSNIPLKPISPELQREIERNTIRVAIFHSCLLIVVLWICINWTPILGDLISGFAGKLPSLLQTSIILSNFLQKYFYYLLVPFYLGLRWDVHIFRRIYQFKGGSAAALWSRSITSILSLMGAFPMLAYLDFTWRMYRRYLA